jgi:hypothetical protein
MLLFAISFGVVDILCIFFLKIRSPESPVFVKFENEPDINGIDNEKIGTDRYVLKGDRDDNNHEIFCFARRNGRQSIAGDINGDPLPSQVEQRLDNDAERPMNLKEILTDVNYQAFVWLFAFASSIGLVYANNITVISKSLHLNNYDDRLTIIIPITNAIISAAVGLFSDFLKDRLPRMWILIFGSICFTISQILVFLFAQTLGLLVVSAMLVGVGIAILWSISPTIMKEMFFVGNLGRNWGIAILIASLVGFGTQEAYGAIYDSKTAPGAVDCYGIDCIRGGSAICMACGSLSIIIGLIIQLRKRCCP